MKYISSYKVKIINEFKTVNQTVRIYHRAVKYIIDVSLEEYENIKSLSSMQSMNYIEQLIHSTSARKAKYHSFDKKFYKMPSYLRRSAVTTANAVVKSHKSQLEHWQSDGCRGKKPKLNRNQLPMPCLYKGNMFSLNDDGTCSIKIFKDNDWKWITVKLRASDLAYITKRFDINLSSAPVIQKINHRYYLRFVFQEKVELPQTSDVICAVDLGINHDAVCSIISRDGTVKARRFINFAKDKDYLNRLRKQIREAQSRGNRHPNKLWRLHNNRNRQLSIQIARAITVFAVEHRCDCIVFEHLDLKGVKSNQKITLWRKREVQRITESLAHKNGLRLARVCAWNTSRLAYDGSGEVKRNKDNYSLCTFSNGKQYNCDLSASYNIGARYFIRDIMDGLSSKIKSRVEAKVPELGKRTTCTLNSLINLNAVLQ